ncbi:hypothetical protein M2262_001996 [Pseudomonas sp. BIGb0408]|uniref:HEAT repeat-containing protein n=1 Tax=Phytopseudomonas flavescens TaxID=29435 RepID=A0A7Y9XLA0_9GAMM|nr:MULTISPECIES: hypothetical protein [Pseudomonas]MCW2291946.1 hypothetical protein [Pseudomonas sp. BIGb0408]NYH73483.1 hypothetical protein [Pseudomonas flavescens]
MNYQDPQPYNKRALEKAFASRDVKSICEALVSVALNDSDWRWAQNKCLEFLRNEIPDVRGLAATCLGHIARIHRQLDKEKVLIALREHLDDNIISGQIADALDDIDMFLR